MLKPYKQWDVYHLSTGDSDFSTIHSITTNSDAKKGKHIKLSPSIGGIIEPFPVMGGGIVALWHVFFHHIITYDIVRVTN